MSAGAGAKEAGLLKGVICYYSATGNTRLVSEYLARRLDIGVDLCNIAKDSVPELSGYGIAGFASPAERMSMPALMRGFIQSLPPAEGKPAFLLATYGSIAGRILENMTAEAHARGFRVVEAHALHVPNSYPPLVAIGVDSRGKPDERNLRDFGDFADRLKAVIADISAGRKVKEYIPKTRLRNTLVPRMIREMTDRRQGPKLVDKKLCTKCGECVSCCPYKVIKLAPLPIFDESLCKGCWACYNLCPEKAIYTRMLRGKGHYPGPSESLKKKLAR